MEIITFSGTRSSERHNMHCTWLVQWKVYILKPIIYSIITCRDTVTTVTYKHWTTCDMVLVSKRCALTWHRVCYLHIDWEFICFFTLLLERYELILFPAGLKMMTLLYDSSVLWLYMTTFLPITVCVFLELLRNYNDCRWISFMCVLLLYLTLWSQGWSK
jgi:hypothetical protein